METTATETLLRRERAIVVAGLAVIAALSWVYLFAGAGMGMSLLEMSRIALSPGIPAGREMAMAMPMPNASAGWTGAYWVLMVVMWWVMMIAMMVPSAAPTILLYARVTRHAQENRRLAPGIVPTAAFAGGYLVAWLGFSVLATVLQFVLEKAGLMSAMMMWSLDPWLSVLVLLAAGVYQLTPLKQACLKHCRSPAQFLSGHWRPGRWGALIMGIDHGAFCVACCWALMALLFVGGIMNLLWIAGLTIFVLVEKVVPRGEWLARLAGAGCIVAAVWIAAIAMNLA